MQGDAIKKKHEIYIIWSNKIHSLFSSITIYEITKYINFNCYMNMLTMWKLKMRCEIILRGDDKTVQEKTIVMVHNAFTIVNEVLQN